MTPVRLSGIPPAVLVHTYKRIRTRWIIDRPDAGGEMDGRVAMTCMGPWSRMRVLAVLTFMGGLCPHSTESAAFLPQLPLEVVSFTPSARSTLSGRDALTVTFNRAVIALGSDFGDEELPADKVPFSVSLSQPAGGAAPPMDGRWRWVTTFVARFDPVSDWPTDVTVDVALNTELATWDGTTLAPSVAQELAGLSFTTPQITMSTSTVRSAQASALTGDAWTAGYSDPREVPPDGVIELQFSRAVDASLLQSALRLELVDASSSSPSVTPDALVVAACAHRWRPDETCVAVEIAGELAVDTEYRLVLPVGSVYHALCGSTQQENAVRVTGLLSFRFPFRQTSIPETTWNHFEPRASRYDLWLRHGLDSSTTLEQLQSAINISPAVQVRLVRHSLGVVRMEPTSDGSGFQPNEQYTITVAANSDVLDGFGLPLESSCSTFNTAESTDFLMNAGSAWANSAAVFPSHDPLTSSWDAIARGDSLCHAAWSTRQNGCAGVDAADAYRISGANIGTIRDVPSMLADLNNGADTFIPETTSAFVDLTVGDSLQSLALQPAENLFGSSGLFLESTWNSGGSSSKRKQSRLVSQTNLAVTFAQTGESTFTVWITDMATNVPVPNCRCTVYKVPYSYNPPPHPSSVVAISSPTFTDENGLATLGISDADNGNLYGVIEDLTSGGLVVVSPLSLFSPPSISVSSVIVTDRGVYKHGDTVHVKLWVRAQEGTEMVVPTAGYELFVQWSRGDDVTPIPIELDATTGAFSISIAVPEDAQYGDRSIILRERVAENRYGWAQQVGQTTVTVADPRPPTVLMTLKPVNDELVMPKSGSLDMQVTCTTYLGTTVAGAVVTVHWQHSVNSLVFTGPNSRSDDPTELSGTFDVHAGPDGLGVATFALPADAVESIAAGDTIEFSATWLGPTREVVTASASIIISESPWNIRLDVSPDQPLPGFEFGSTVDIQEYGSGLAHHGGEAQVSLYEEGSTQIIRSANQNISVGTAIGEACVVVVGGAVGCPMTLPSIGKFILVSCATDPNGQQICESLELGKTLEEWETAPLTNLADVSMIPDRQAYSQGDTAIFNFYCPFTDARALVVWGNRLMQRNETMLLPQGSQMLSLPIGDECLGGCAVTIIVSSPAQTSLPTLPVDLATSSLFDISLPQRIVSHHTLTVTGESRQLEVSIAVDEAELTPGSSAGFTVALVDQDGNPVSGEVCLFAVDKAFLNVKPHASVDLPKRFELDLAPGHLSTVSNTGNLIGGTAYDSSKARISSLASKEPWLSLGTWSIRAGQNPAFDLAEDEYLAQSHSEFITDQPPTFDPWRSYDGEYVDFDDGDEMRSSDGMFAESEMVAMAPVMADDASDTPAPSPPPGASIETGDGTAASTTQMSTPIRSAFETTPLFLPTLRVDSSGSVHVDWSLPDNVGTFVIRAYAAASGSRFGVAADAEQVVRQPVSLVPSVPRISRVGDEFTCGVTVTASEAGFRSNATLSVSIQSGGLTLTTPDVQTVAVDSTRPREITFGFSATTFASLETTNLIFDLVVGESTDALAAEIPMRPPQQSVSVATSMGITAQQSLVPWMEGLQLPDAVPDSGSLDLLVGVGYLPAVRTIAVALTSPAPCSDDNTNWCSSHDLISSMAAAPCLKVYLGDSDDAVSAAQSVFDHSLALLETFTDDDGLRYSLRKYRHANVDVYLNAFALYVVREVEERNSASIPGDTNALQRLWRAALIRGLAESVEDAQTHGYTFASWEVVARARLALGVGAFEGLSQSTQETLSMASLLSAAVNGDRCGSFCTAATAVILLRENPRDASATALLQSFADDIRVTGRTAYISSASSPNALDMGTQSLVLQGSLLSALTPIPLLLLQKLANYVAEGGDDTYGWRSRGADGVMRMFVLSYYDSSFGSNDPSIMFKATAGSTILLTGDLSSAAPGPLSSSTSWSVLPRPPPPLVLWAAGSGQLNVAAALRFVPSVMPSSPVYRGLYVQQVIRQLVNGEPTGPPLRAVPLGSMVSITLQVTTPDDLHSAVRVESWLPAGLEPLLRLASPDTGSNPVGYGCGEGLAPFASRSFGYGWWWMCPDWEMETMADRVTWYASRGIRAGTHTLTFEAVAATVGRFALPPAQALVVMQPEVMGLSTGGMFEVGAPGDLTDAEMVLPDTGTPSDCPADCSGQGICDVVTGTCRCTGDASGDDCSQVSGEPLTLELVVEQPAEPTLLTLVGLEPYTFDWLGALSSDETVVPSSSIHVDRDSTPPTVRWEGAPGVDSGSATVTLVATRGSKVVYRAFTATFSEAGHAISQPLAFEDYKMGELQLQGEGDSKSSAATRATSPGAAVVIALLLVMVAMCGAGYQAYVSKDVRGMAVQDQESAKLVHSDSDRS